MATEELTGKKLVEEMKISTKSYLDTLKNFGDAETNDYADKKAKEIFEAMENLKNIFEE